MSFRETTPVHCALMVLLAAGCPGDDSSAEGSGSSGSGSTSTGEVTVTASTTTSDGTTVGMSSSSSGSVDSTSGGSTDTTGSTGEVTGSSSGDGSSSGSGESSSGGVLDPCDGPEVLLYEQAPLGAMAGAPAGTGIGGFIRSADDFEIDAADQCWCVTRVVLSGVFDGATLDGDLEIGFYDDAPGLPLNPPLVVDAGAPIDTNGVFDYTLGIPAILPAGIHWLAAMPALPDIGAGIWFWLPTAVMSGNQWAMETDFPPFLPACQTWTPGGDCFPPAMTTDLAFEIYGTIGGDACM